MDVNDHTPQCAESLFTFSAEEANELQIELGTVTATDGDVQSPVGSGELRYQLVSSNLQSVSISSMVRQTPHHWWPKYSPCTVRVLYLVSQGWTLTH